MKQRISLFFLVVTWISGFSQVSVTYDKNSPIPGDSCYYLGIQFINPGPGGKDIIWDFSGIQADNKDFICQYPFAPTQTLTGTAPYNLLLADNGYEFYLQNQPDKLVEVAMTKGNMSFLYTDPLVRMKYPFSYGHEFVDAFNGNAFFPDRPAYLISGNYSVIADGSGTLKFPGLVLHNVLRIQQRKNFSEIHSCNTLTSNQEVYKWYAPGYRYPVLAVSIITNQADNHNPTVIKSAYLNLNQDFTDPNPGNSATVVNSPENDIVPVSVFPNPFIDKLSYLYYLKDKARFSLQITDVYGNEVRQLINDQQQAKGMHSGELDLSPYTIVPGVYILKFVFDSQVITRKVVKIL